MPATALAFRLEQAYASALSDLWARVVAIVAAHYDAMDTEDLVAAFSHFLLPAAEVIRLGQGEAQRLAAAFVTQYIETEAQRAFRAAPLAPGIAGHTRDGAPLREALAGATGMVWMALQQGRSAPDALTFGRLQVSAVSQTAVQDAANREQSHQADRSRGLMSGWTWQTSGADSCPACLALQNGEENPWSEMPDTHPNCSCIRAPIISGVPDDEPRPTGDDIFNEMDPDQQASIFKNAGEEKAALIRDGQATLADFVAIDVTARGEIVTEAPLQAVL